MRGVENKGSLGFPGGCAALGLLGPAGTWTAAVKKHWRQSSAELQPRELKRGSPLAEVTAKGMGSSSQGEPERRHADADKSRFVDTERLSTAPPCGSAGQRQRRPRRIPGRSRAHPDRPSLTIWDGRDREPQGGADFLLSTCRLLAIRWKYERDRLTFTQQVCGAILPTAILGWL